MVDCFRANDAKRIASLMSHDFLSCLLSRTIVENQIWRRTMYEAPLFEGFCEQTDNFAVRVNMETRNWIVDVYNWKTLMMNPQRDSTNKDWLCSSISVSPGDFWPNIILVRKQYLTYQSL